MKSNPDFQIPVVFPMPSYPFIHVLEFYCHAICYEHHGLQIVDDPGTCLELETRECESVYINSSYTFRYASIGLQQDRDRIMLGDAICHDLITKIKLHLLKKSL